MKVNVITVPGHGHREVEVTSDTKLGEIVGRYSNRGTSSVMVDGKPHAPDTWDKSVTDGCEVWLIGGVKGHPAPNPTNEERLKIIKSLKKQVATTQAFQEMIDIWRTDAHQH